MIDPPVFQPCTCGQKGAYHGMVRETRTQYRVAYSCSSCRRIWNEVVSDEEAQRRRTVTPPGVPVIAPADKELLQKQMERCWPEAKTARDLLKEQAAPGFDYESAISEALEADAETLRKLAEEHFKHSGGVMELVDVFRRVYAVGFAAAVRRKR